MSVSKFLFSCVLACCLLGNLTARGEIKLEKNDDGVTVKIDNDLFTVYRIKSGAKPILWPVVGPTGKEMTRAFPMREVAGEKTDHIHQRSFWLTHGEVNGVSFWMEQGEHGTIEHQGFDKVESGPVGLLVARNLWKSKDGTVQCEETRTLRFGSSDSGRWIDFDAIFKPAGGKPIVFGDTKEGAFGVRVAEALAVDAKKGGKIVNSNGETDKDAWGKRATWVDYFGPLEGETLGIAILNHPSSFRHPTYWHVRTYGLFAANPFGVKDFTGKKEDNGSHTVEAGQTLRLRHRVILHKGDEKAGKISAEYERFAAEQ